MIILLLKLIIICHRLALATTARLTSQYLYQMIQHLTRYLAMHLIMTTQSHSWFMTGVLEIMLRSTRYSQILIGMNWLVSRFDADSIWDCFKSIVWPIIAIHVPTKIVPHNMKYKVRWYPKHIRKLISRKEVIWRTLKRTHEPSLKIKYDKIANDCKLAILNHDKQREERILGSNNLGAFFKFVNKKLSSKSGTAPLLTPSGQTTTSDLDKAEILNEYFESAFTLDNGINPPFPPRVNPSHDGIYDVTINPTIIRTILRSLKSNSAAGPDCLPPIFFKQTASELAFPLPIIYRTFIDLHTLPTEWRHANITPKF